MRRSLPLLMILASCLLAMTIGGLGCNSDDGGTTPPPADQCSLNVLAPAAGDDFTSGDPVSIRWDEQGDAATVTIELIQAGNSVGVIAAATENDGFFPWNADVMSGVGGDFVVRITADGETNCTDDSGVFSLVNTAACGIVLTFPQVPDTTLVAGLDLPITWRSHDTTGSIHIDLMNGHLLESLVGVIAQDTSDDGLFDWTMDSFNFSAHRDNVDDSVYWLRIYDENVPSCADFSSDFTLIDTDLCLIDTYITPFGDVLDAGQQVDIGINFHDPDPSDMVKIRLYAGNVAVPGGYITQPGQDLPATTQIYTWTVQDYGFATGGSFFNVRVIKADDPYCWGKTDNFAVRN